MIPIARLTTLARTVVASPSRTKIRTQRAKVHKAGEDDDPEVLRVDDITTIELEELAVRYVDE